MSRISMTMWAAEDIPSVKAQNIGYRGLSNAELLSIIIGNGTMSENAVELARKILADNNNSLRKVSKLRLDELTGINGIGDMKASKIFAALELGNRINMERAEESPDLSTATRIYNYMQPRIGGIDVEEFWVLYLNQNYRLITAKRISVGGICETAVDARIILREALLSNATMIIAVHNHPSGSLQPSKADDELTFSVSMACKAMRIKLNDHVIVTENAYYSYKEQGKL